MIKNYIVAVIPMLSQKLCGHLNSIFMNQLYHFHFIFEINFWSVVLWMSNCCRVVFVHSGVYYCSSTSKLINDLFQRYKFADYNSQIQTIRFYEYGDSIMCIHTTNSTNQMRRYGAHFRNSIQLIIRYFLFYKLIYYHGFIFSFVNF